MKVSRLARISKETTFESSRVNCKLESKLNVDVCRSIFVEM